MTDKLDLSPHHRSQKGIIHSCIIPKKISTSYRNPKRDSQEVAGVPKRTLDLVKPSSKEKSIN